MSAWMSALAGRFLVFDGPDGSGKSTQLDLLRAACREIDLTVCDVREPGGTNIGEQIRDVLLDPANAEMSVGCEMMLYMASRAQLITERIQPALQRGELVLADRFISSTLAYQGTAGGIEATDILTVGRVAIGDLWPDWTVVFDVDEQTAASRLSPLLDRMEQKGAAFHRRVRQGYLDQAAADPERYIVVDATADPDIVFARLTQHLQERLEAQPAARN